MEKLFNNVEKLKMPKILLILLLSFFIPFLSACSTPEEEAKASEERGIELYNEGEYAQAALEFRSAIQEDQNVANAYYYLGLINEKSRKYKAMKENLLKAVELAPENIDAKIRLGKVHLLFNDVESSLIQADEVLKLQPEQLDAMTLKASALVRDKKLADAVVIIDSVLLKDPKHSEAVSLKAALLMEDQNFDGALAVLNPAIVRDKKNISLHLLKIKLDAKNKDLAAVISDYENLIETFPDKDEFKYALAKIYVLAKKNDLAEKMLTDLAEYKPGQVKPKLVLLGFYNALDQAKVQGVLESYVKGSQDNPKNLITFAKWALTANKIQEAKDILLKVRESKNVDEDNRTSASVLLAQIYLEQGEFASASDMVEQVLEKISNHSEAKIIKAKLLVQQEKLDEAVSILNTVLWDVPNSDETIVLLGNIFQLQGKPDEAKKSFKQALEINPGNVQALFPVVDYAINHRQIDYAKELLQKALRYQPTHLLILNKLVQIAMAEKDWESAKQYIAVMERQPKANLLAQLLTGKMYQEQGNCNDAIVTFKQALEKSPAQAELLTEMARCYENLGKRSAMLKYLDESLNQFPNNISAIVLKSKLLTLNNKFDSSVSLLNEAIASSPGSVNLYLELARVYQAQKAPEKEIDVYQKGLNAASNNLELSMLLASAYMRQLNYNEAVGLYEDILKINPRLDIARNNLASILMDNYGSPEDIEKAVTLVGRFKSYDHPYYQDSFAWAEFKSGRFNEALSVLQKVIVAEPTNPIFRFHLAQVYKALGNETAAVSELREAIDLAKTENFTLLPEAKKLLAEWI